MLHVLFVVCEREINMDGWMDGWMDCVLYCDESIHASITQYGSIDYNNKSMPISSGLDVIISRTTGVWNGLEPGYAL